MKNILITGENSYIGTSLEVYVARNYGTGYHVDSLDMHDEVWKEYDFSKYDSLFHVVGIAHIDAGKLSAEKEKLYYTVNTDLAIETAKKAKSEGVKQFIFMSSSIVYGSSAPIGKDKVITKDTPVNPTNCYGDSKVQAEKGLLALADETFKVVILRPPMIYGKGCKGNYKFLSKIAQKFPIFPLVENKRSMLYVENLCEFVHLMIQNEEEGIFWPQNKEYSNTSEMVKMIAEAHGKRIILVPYCTWLLKGMSFFTTIIDKAFGNLVYNCEMSEYKENYRVTDLRDSIHRTEF